jgi:ferrous iron transport protein A
VIKQQARALVRTTPRAGLFRRLGWGATRAAQRRIEQDAAGATVEIRALSRLRPGERDVVCHVAGSGPVHQRLLELGVTPGAMIEVIRFAPLGDPIEVRVRGYHLSLRRREAEAIWVGREDRERERHDAPGTERCRSGGQSK